MNNYGQPDSPEVAMLGELHTLWERVMGGGVRRGVGMAVGLIGVVVVALVWVVL